MMMVICALIRFVITSTNNLHGFSDEIRITFSSKDDHTCSTSLFNSDDDMELSAWPTNIIIGENKFTARLGPSGGVRGYMSITGKKFRK